jgi:hypothetical protein
MVKQDIVGKSRCLVLGEKQPLKDESQIVVKSRLLFQLLNEIN